MDPTSGSTSAGPSGSTSAGPSDSTSAEPSGSISAGPSGSTSAEVLEEIRALFKWNPPVFVLDKKKSITTRLPSFFDKHYLDKYILKRVQRLPTLVTDLDKNVDTALDAALTSLPPLGNFMTTKIRESNRTYLSTRVIDEKGVAEYYLQTTARYCSPVASTLAVHPNASFSNWLSLVSWTQSVSPSGYAIMDGQLCFTKTDDEETTKEIKDAMVDTIEERYRDIFKEMRELRSPLATWEMKSLSAGPIEVMTSVPNLGEFNWTRCSECTGGKGIDAKHQKSLNKVKELVVGPDAKTPPWQLPLNHEQGSGSSTAPVTPPPTTKDKGKKRKRDDGDGDGDGDDDDDDKAYQDRHDITAQNLVQQAWAQAVRVDGTVIVLHSGNHELVCVRHRGTQTLYVSDIIEPSTCINPGYGKLHVGIYVAAIQDTMDRKLQQRLFQTKPGDGGDSAGSDKKDQDGGDSTGGDKKDQDRNRDSGSRGKGPIRRSERIAHGGGKSSGKKGSARMTGPDNHQKAIHMASSCDVVFLYLQYDIYNSPVPASFLRSTPSIIACSTSPFFPRPIDTYGPEECLTVILTSEIGHGATGVALRGRLELDGAMPLDVVVKLAFNFEQRDALRSEYEVYRCLRSKGVLQGIATALGFFDDCEGAACALIMLYAGIPLSTESQGTLSISDCESALSTLESIHRAGILHGDIRQDNILIGDSGVTIIDFGHSMQCGSQRAKSQEIAKLRYLLGLAGQ